MKKQNKHLSSHCSAARYGFQDLFYLFAMVDCFNNRFDLRSQGEDHNERPGVQRVPHYALAADEAAVLRNLSPDVREVEWKTNGKNVLSWVSGTIRRCLEIFE